MQEKFENECLDKRSCEFEVNTDWFSRDCTNRVNYYALGSRYNNYAKHKGWTRYVKDGRRREPIFFGVAFCVADTVYHPLSGDVLDMSKQDFGYMIMYVDIVVILSTIFVINLFQKRYLEYAKVFDKRNVEMRDFSVLISNLPFDHQYGGKDVMLQALLWEHIEKRLQTSFELPLIKSNNEF